MQGNFTVGDHILSADSAILALLCSSLSLVGFALGVFGAWQEYLGTRETNAAMTRDAAAATVNRTRAAVRLDEHMYLVNAEENIALYVNHDVLSLGEMVEIGEEYIVYYLPHSFLIVSAEPVADA